MASPGRPSRSDRRTTCRRSTTTIEIGGSIFDAGNYQNYFTGDLAEIIVLRNGSLAMATLVEGYLKAKYDL